MWYNKLMDKEKVAEKQGGNQETKWDALKSAKELTPDEIIARRERNFGKAEKKSETEKKAEKKTMGKSAELLTELEEPEKKETKEDVKKEYSEIKKEPEWKKPKIEQFTFDKQVGMPEDKLVFQFSEDKLGAVPREKAVWSFMEYVNDAKTADEFRVANRIAGALEARPDITPEERAQIADFRENPAYKFKETGFVVKGIAKRAEQSKSEFNKAKAAYTAARKGGPFKRLFNRMEIRNLKNRMEWWEKRTSDEEGNLATKQAELDQLIKAGADQEAAA